MSYQVKYQVFEIKREELKTNSYDDWIYASILEPFCDKFDTKDEAIQFISDYFNTSSARDTELIIKEIYIQL